MIDPNPITPLQEPLLQEQDEEGREWLNLEPGVPTSELLPSEEPKEEVKVIDYIGLEAQIDFNGLPIQGSQCRWEK